MRDVHEHRSYGILAQKKHTVLDLCAFGGLAYSSRRSCWNGSALSVCSLQSCSMYPRLFKIYVDNYKKFWRKQKLWIVQTVQDLEMTAVE